MKKLGTLARGKSGVYTLGLTHLSIVVIVAKNGRVDGRQRWEVVTVPMGWQGAYKEIEHQFYGTFEMCKKYVYERYCS